ncbi:MAG: sulfate adenylyltransferase subunit 1 [Rhodomicrobium sp.]
MSGLAQTARPETGATHARREKPHLAIAGGAALPSKSQPLREPGGIVHILTCGSVDDGKSTLIGRLLWDASGLPEDQREMVRRAARAKGDPDRLDYSLLLDGLAAEREQGITIDVAWRYLDTPKRRLVLIDSPGHDQYTRNMASGASHADAAVMLIDARHGLKQQTRRHAAILQLMGVFRIVLAVNKMDLVDWSETRFREIERDFVAAATGLGFMEALAIPVSARHGDNVAAPSKKMPWYAGPSLVDHLEGIPGRQSGSGGAFRMPVQTVLRDGQDFRGLAGTISSGTVHVGDEVADVTTGRSARVVRIATMDGDLGEAAKGKAVALVLDTDLDVARGAVLAAPDVPPVRASSVEARIVWLAERSFEAGHGLMLRTATDLVPVAAIQITAHVDLDTLSLKPASKCSTNDIAAASIALGRPAAFDPFSEQAETGTFLLVDYLTGATLAAGIVMAARTGTEGAAAPQTCFWLTRDVLARGLCSDLGGSEADAREYRRRASEVVCLLAAASVAAAFEEPPLTTAN